MRSDQNHQWTVMVKKLESSVRIGIHEHEKIPQRILVDAWVRGKYPAVPSTIDQCFNYEVIYDRVVRWWPKQPHVDLLETLVVDLLAYIFSSDARVLSAKVRIHKPDIYAEAVSVSAQTEWTRADFDARKIPPNSPSP